MALFLERAQPGITKAKSWGVFVFWNYVMTRSAICISLFHMLESDVPEVLARIFRIMANTDIAYGELIMDLTEPSLFVFSFTSLHKTISVSIGTSQPIHMSLGEFPKMNTITNTQGVG